MSFALCKNGISYCAATALLLAAVRGRGGEGRGGEGRGVGRGEGREGEGRGGERGGEGRGGEGRGGRGGEGEGRGVEGRGEVSQCAYRVNMRTCRVSHEKYAHSNVYTVHIQFPALKVVLHA